MENRERMDGGTIVLPRTLTSRVPNEISMIHGFKIYPTISCFIKAMLRITMTCENHNFVSSVLQTYGCIYYESFCSTNAQVRMKEDNVLSGA